MGSPQNLIVSSDVYKNDITAISVVRGIYSQMSSNGGGFANGSPSSISLLCGLSADEFVNYANGSQYIAFYTNGLTSTNFAQGLWNEPYTYINIANSILEGLKNNSGVSLATKNDLIGESKFVRSFCFFYLVNLFGDVPLVTTTNYQNNIKASRNSKDEVYSQIISDLIDAQRRLSSDFSFSNGERDQPNKFAATALLARVYSYTSKWDSAEAEANMVINETGTYHLAADLDSVFLANSPEAIWQLKPVASTINTLEGNTFILDTYPTYVSLSNELLDAFEIGDKRRENWVNQITIDGFTYYYPYKYKVKASTELTEYSMILRLSEQYLIRAEARAHQGNLSGALEDLNIIRSRAGLPELYTMDKTELLDTLFHERQVELFSEWGHRWMDLKRTGKVDSVMNLVATKKGGSWSTAAQLYPLPQSELNSDANLVQNAGY